jgi:ADP-ribose pyrophosphatase YjhB (NUDIX family)
MKPIRNSAKAIIIQDDKLLAIKLADEQGFWYTLPGGGQEPGEPLHDALRRECIEEINAEVEILGLRFVRDYIGKNHEFVYVDSDSHSVDLMFMCKLAEGADPRPGSVPDPSQVGLEWLPLDSLDSYRLYPLGLRSLIARHNDPAVPVYLGDIN